MSQDVGEKKLTASEAFSLRVIREFGSGVGDFALTNFQRRLVGNYFIGLDAALKMAEEKRLKKSDKYRDQVPVTWAHVNMQQLARDVVACARVGLDPMQKNHINMVPFKNNTTGQYDIAFVPGYRGLEVKAKKYGLDIPDTITVELVYKSDEFHAIKKDAHNSIESYEFKITNEFDRGKIIGGFYYHAYSQTPQKNKLVTMSIKEIEKRKPQYASTEFWGGEKDVWGKDPDTGHSIKTGTETVEGWYERMAWKTVFRAAYSDITIDSEKIDEAFLRLSQMEQDLTKAEVDEEIAQNANKQMIDVEYTDVPSTPQTPPAAPAKPAPPKHEPAPQSRTQQAETRSYAADSPDPSMQLHDDGLEQSVLDFEQSLGKPANATGPDF